MPDLLTSFLVLTGLSAFVAIGPWLRVARANDDETMRRALQTAAFATILFLGVFVLYAIASAASMVWGTS